MSDDAYRALASSCARIDRRKTHYRFDLDADVRWNQIGQRGLQFGPAILEAMGVDLSSLTAPAQELFQWAYALSVCESFYRLEDLIIRFARQEHGQLGPTRSMELLCEEELKHMELFARYGDHLRAQRPDLAERFDALRGPPEVLAGSPEDSDSYLDVASYHYVFWINTLFFEEFTVFLHDCLHLDMALIQPTWADLHRCHWQEEIQHIPTDVAHLDAIALSPEQLHTMSKVFFFRLEEDFHRMFGLEDAWALLADVHPEAAGLTHQRAFRELPLFRELLTSPTFRRTRQCAPYLVDLAKAAAAAPPSPARVEAHLSGPPLPPLRATTLSEALRQTAAHRPHAGLVYVQDDGSELRETYAELLRRAERIAAAFAAQGLTSGDRVVILLPRPQEFVAVFWGCQLAGLVPAALGVAGRAVRNLEDDTRLAKIVARLEAACVVVDDGLLTPGATPPEWRVIPVSALSRASSTPPPAATPVAQPTDLAYLQFSSGSTGDPRGVILSQRNVIANVEASIQHLRLTPRDTMVNWLPLHHDMGLCCHLTPLVGGWEQVLLTPFLFARRPNLWLTTLHTHRATITPSPNFGLALSLRRLTPSVLASLDLSALRIILNGAEPISASLAERFLAALAPARLSAEAMCPSYGMAEATVAITQVRPGEGLRSRTFARDSLHDPAGVRQVPATDPQAVRLVDVGVPDPGVEVRITDAEGSTVAPGVVGQIKIRGPNVTSGYWGDPAATAEALDADGWLSSGDLGLIQDGRLYVAGRMKNVLFVNGRNVLAPDLEALLQDVDGLTPDRLAVVGSTHPTRGTERVVAFVKHRPRSGHTKEAVASAVSARLANALQSPVHQVVFLRSNQFPLTTSGKLQRHRLRDSYERGEFDDQVVSGGAAPRSSRSEEAPALPATSPPKSEEMVEAVRAIWASVLDRPVDEIGIDDRFLSLGGDSVRAVEVHGCLENRWGRMLDQRILLECSTVREQAAFLADLPGIEAEGPGPVAPPQPSAGERDVAVIAMAGRFPGASDPEAFWELLREGRTAFREAPAERWDKKRYYHPDPAAPGKTVCTMGAFLEGFKELDPEACGLSTEEARQIDPQQRLFLEVVQDLVDQAHLATRKVGVFAGAGFNEYFWGHSSVTQRITRLSAQTNLANMVAARVAQLFQFTGPALTLDVACSTSLVAVHYACRSLRDGECELAIAGGVQLNLTVVPYLIFSQAGVLSARGRCQPFSREADGFVPGEGVGAVLLKPLRAALRDEDPILGVIRGSAVNNDGGSMMSGMAPNPAGQQDVLRQAYAAAGVDRGTITYMEGHGTGTRVGDPVEVRSLAQVFAGCPPGSIGLGSVKSNVGHLFHAAGICALIKVLLALRHKAIPPTLGCEEPDPRIRFERTPFAPVQSLRAWTVPAGGPRRAGINAFGVGGTNCHVIVEEPPHLPSVTSARDTHLLCMSAPGPADLQRVGASLANALEAQPDLELANFCAQANQRAGRFQHRRALVLGSRGHALEALRAPVPDAPVPTRRRPRLVFLFSGPGSQYPAMGHHLRGEPAFREALSACDTVLRPLMGRSLEALLDSEADELNRIDHAQPVVFAFGYALAKWLESLDVVPEAVVGHSAGEYAAACVAGVLSLEEAATLVYERGRAMSATEPGRMAAVLAPEERVRAALADASDVDIACLNEPDQVVISGRATAVEAVLAALARDGVQSRPLSIPCAAHSPLMLSAQEAFSPFLQGVQFQPPRLAFFSTLVGARVLELDSAYWLDHLRAPVRFATAVRAALAAGYRQFVEVGPSAALSYCVSRVAEEFDHANHAPQAAVEVYPLVRRSLPGWGPTLETLGQLFEGGVDLNTARLDGSQRRKWVALPAYPYQRRELWLEPPPLDLPVPSKRRRKSDRPERPGPLPLDLETCPSVRDHRVYGEMTAPSALLIDLVLAESAASAPGSGLEDILIGRALPLEPGAVRLARVREVQADGASRVVLETRRDEHGSPWEEHLSARFVPLRRDEDWPAVERDLEAIRSRCRTEIPVERFYEHVARGGMTYGPTMQTVAEIWQGEGELLARLELSPRPVPGARAPHAIHPALLDGALSSVGSLTLPFPAMSGSAFLGFAIRRLAVREPLLESCLAHVRLRPDCTLNADAQAIRFDVTLLDSAGSVLAVLEEVCLKRHARDEDARPANLGQVQLVPGSERFYSVEWEPIDRPAGLRETPPSGSTVLVGPATPLRTALQRELEAVEGVAFILPFPGPEAPWEPLLSRVLPDPSRAAATRFVVLEPDLDQLAGLVRALARQRVGALGDLLVVSSDAAVLGFLRALAREEPTWTCRGVEVAAGELTMPGLSKWVHDELRAPPSETVVGYRDGQRWVPALRRVEPPPSPAPLRPGGVYWITGGLGALGRTLAEALAYRVGARLLLTGRRPHADPAALARIEGAGGEVLYVPADVTDRAAMERARESARLRWGQLDGVIHAAGTVDDVLIGERVPDRSAAVLRPKTVGAEVLAAVTADEPLDFLVFFSSLVAVSGMPGQTDYAAANAYQDALAHRLREQGRPAKSLNWGPWRVGMAGEDRYQRQYLSLGLHPFSPQAGVRAFLRALACDEVQLAVVDLEERRVAELIAGLNRPARSAAPAPTLRPADPAAPARMPNANVPVGELVRSVVAQHLRWESSRVDPDAPFTDLGIDSLLAVSIVKQIQRELDIHLYPTLLFELQTLTELTDHLESLLAEGGKP